MVTQTKVAVEYRTVMYKVEENGEVTVHRFPWNWKDEFGREKLQRMIKRGFLLNDPCEEKGNGGPEVIVTGKPKLAAMEGESAEGVKICGVCGKECRGSFGLQAHQRSHKVKETSDVQVHA